MKPYRILSVFSVLFFIGGALLLFFPKLFPTPLAYSPDDTNLNDLTNTGSEAPVQASEPVYNPEFHLSNEQEQLSFNIPILMFHYIQDIPSNTRDQLGYRLSYAPQKLEELLIFLKDKNIETLDFRDLKAIIEGKKKQPERAVILSFDDGHKDHYTNAFPLLKKHNAKAVFFIISDKAEKDPKFANWQELKEISNAGFEIGSHSVSHSSLSSLSKATQQYELKHSKEVLEEKIGKPIISFCYPAGRYNQTTLNIAREHYLFARTTQAGSILKVKKRYQLPTIRIHPTTKIKNLAPLWDIKEEK